MIRDISNQGCATCCHKNICILQAESKSDERFDCNEYMSDLIVNAFTSRVTSYLDDAIRSRFTKTTCTIHEYDDVFDSTTYFIDDSDKM